MKKIIIIGATSGIGRGLAEVYSQEDYLIGITGRRENLLEEVCARDKDKLFYQVCDITDTQATISSLETLTQKMGGMDILIICAGTGELNPELSYQLEEPTLLTNVIGFTNIADWGFRYFEQQKSGHLVTISSVGGSGKADHYDGGAGEAACTGHARQGIAQHGLLFVPVQGGGSLCAGADRKRKNRTGVPR